MKQICDVVMEGGGVKGIGLVGALSVLSDAGYEFRRVAGTSAGAIAGSLLAAGMPISKMQNLLENLDYKQFRDEGWLDKLGVHGKGLSLLLEQGVFEGKFLHNWLTQQLESAGVRTFADLKSNEPWAQKLPPEQRYKLVVITADISKGRLVRLPWDYKLYGLNPDEQPVADAVRASMSLPFFYEPFKIGESYLVDGGTLSNFPISLFDSTPDIPTFGIKLSAKPEANSIINPVSNTYEFARAILETMLSAHDSIHLDDPCTLIRTMFVDSGSVKTTDFDIKPESQHFLLKSGQEAAKKFLKSWSFDKYKAQCSV